MSITEAPSGIPTEAPVPKARRRPRDPVRTALGMFGVAVLGFLYLPIITMIVYSFNSGRVLVVWGGFGTGNYGAAIANPALIGSVTTSLKAAVGSSFLATILGTLLGIGMAQRRGMAPKVLLGLLLLVLVTPEIVDAVALLIWFVQVDGPFGPANHLVNYGLVRLWFGHGIYSTAVVALIVRARMASLDPALEEAAADLYAPPLRRLRQVVLPLTMPAVIAGFLLAFSLSLDNTIISSFVSVAGSTPWSVYVFSAVRNGIRPEIAAMATLLLLVTGGTLALVGVVLRRGASSLSELS